MRDAAGIEHLGVQRRVRAVEIASQWREHRPATTRERLDVLQAQLISLHGGSNLPAEEELGGQLRAEG